MLFVHQALTWGFLLTLGPLLIHLINLMRRKRVEWAAMEFLLQSYKKTRHWVWLKQLLLLLARMAAVALVVALLAQLRTRDQWLAMFGGQTTHHYVLLDDSFSMSERTARTSAFDVAREAVAAIGKRAANGEGTHRLTVIRYSRADQPPTGDSLPSSSAVADFNAELISTTSKETFDERRRQLEVSALASGPGPALKMVRQLIDEAPSESAQLCVVSDFRRRDWTQPAEIRDQLQELQKQGVDLTFVECARAGEDNLTLLEVAPTDDTRAAGVPLFVQIKVKNHSAKAVQRVQLKVRSTYYPPANPAQFNAEKYVGVSEDIGTLLIDEMGPGETISRRVQVYFPQPGKHVVEATLPEDAVAADNHRSCVIDFPDGQPVLIVDGSDEQKHAYFLEAVFRPLERSNTGIRPEARPASYLREATAEALQQYAVIYLLDVLRLDERATANLEDYLRAGGGVCVFAGENIDPQHYQKQLYREGQGFFPAPLGEAGTLPPPMQSAPPAASEDEPVSGGSTDVPDIELTNHPLFSFFLSETNPLIRGVLVDKFRKVAGTWKPDAHSTTQIIARLRDGSPLVLERPYGKGRVLAILTTLAPQWNDWAKNPSFIVLLLKTQAYLASPSRFDDPRLVGTPLDVKLSAEEFRRELIFTYPGAKDGERSGLEQIAIADADNPQLLLSSLGRSGRDRTHDGQTDRPGIYEAWPVTLKGEFAPRRWALNVVADEGDTASVDDAELARVLQPLKIKIRRAEELLTDEDASRGANLTASLFTGLIGLLLLEQWLAYQASYHVLGGRT
jgi:hypothetical protein